jgi:hypothetical protein
MLPAHASNGCSQQTRLAPKWAVPIPLLPKSHNHCAEPLGHPRDPVATINHLIQVLDSQKLAAAITRMEKGYGLKVVK